jgi:hypothetical protein
MVTDLVKHLVASTAIPFPIPAGQHVWVRQHQLADHSKSLINHHQYPKVSQSRVF